MLQFKDGGATLLLGFPMTFPKSKQLNFVASVTGSLSHTTGEMWSWGRCIWNSLFCGLRGNVTMQKSQAFQKIIES